MAGQCYATPDLEFPDDSIFDFDDSNRDPDFVPNVVLDSASDTDDSDIGSFVAIGTVSYRPLGLDLPVTEECPVSPVIPLPEMFEVSTNDTEKPKTKGTKLDKRHFCMFCGKGVTKLERHFISHHEKEPELFDFRSAVGKTKREELKKLRHAGDHLHNVDILKRGDGNIVVKRKINRHTTNDDFVPCPNCLGYFLKRDLWRHKCPSSKGAGNIPTRQLVKNGRLILPAANADGIGEVYESLRKDQVSIIVKNDEVIKLVAQREFKRNGHDKDRHAHIRNKIRELGRLLIKLRDKTGKHSAQLKEFIGPSYFQDVLDSTKQLAGYSTESKTYATPVLALKIGHSLQKCSILLKAQAIERKDTQMRSDCDAFEELIKIKWNEEISSQASRTLHQNKKNKANGIPLSEDVATLSKYLDEQSVILRKELETAEENDKKKKWIRLAEITLTIIILFNRRRQGEVSKMTVHDYMKGLQTEYHNEDALAGLTNFEKALCKKLKRIEITGKRGRLVPVILTDNMKSCTDMLLKKREDAGISQENPYFFARTNNFSLGHFRGCDCLRKLTEEIPLKHPHLLRSTFLRKHIAMFTQLVNLKDNELDVIAQYMGHDIRVHREHYRLPCGTVQVAKVAKLLMTLDRGKVPSENELNDDTIEYNDADRCSGDDDDDDDDDADNDNVDDRIDTPSGSGTSVPISRNQKRCKRRETRTSPETEPPLKTLTGQRDMSGRRRWSTEEEEACMRGFRRQFAVGYLPGKSEIMKVIQNEPVLADRSWIQVKNFIRNRINKSK